MKIQRANPLVTICIPFSRKVDPDWAISLAQIQYPMNGIIRLVREVGKKRDLAREAMAEACVEQKSKFMLFLDDDVTVPPYIVRKLVQEFGNQDDDVMVIAGIYCTKTQPAVPIVFKKIGEGTFYKWKLGEVFEVDIAPTGMMMIRTEVFQHLSKPWFKDIESAQEAMELGIQATELDGYQDSDDSFFCRKIKEETDFRILAHAGVQGIHWDDKGNAYMLPDNSYPIRVAMEERYGKESAKDQFEYWNRVMAVYRDAYGHLDILPILEPELREAVQ